MVERQTGHSPFDGANAFASQGMEQQERAPAYSSYAHLTKMLSQGWQIEPPVYIRPRWKWRLRLKQENTYHFVLRHGQRSSLISVFDGPDVREFIKASKLAVDRL